MKTYYPIELIVHIRSGRKTDEILRVVESLQKCPNVKIRVEAEM